MFNEYPYRNIEDLNLDYLQARVRNLEKIVEQFVALESVTFADPIQWNITTQYAKNVVVLDDQGNAFISKKSVPRGVYLYNEEYWLEIFNFMDYVKSFDSNLTFHIEANTDRATAAYSANDWLLWDDILYKVTAAIAIDDLLVIGTNLERFTVEDFCRAWQTYMVNTIAQYKLDTDADILQYKHDIDESEAIYRAQLAGDIASTTASLQAQLDAAIAGATVDSEVINARVGADGYTYATLGAAITKQIGDIKANMNAVDLSNFCEGKYPLQFTQGLLNSDGHSITASNYAIYTENYFEATPDLFYAIVSPSCIVKILEYDENYELLYAEPNLYGYKQTTNSAGATVYQIGDYFTLHAPTAGHKYRFDIRKMQTTSTIFVNEGDGALKLFNKTEYAITAIDELVRSLIGGGKLKLPTGFTQGLLQSDGYGITASNYAIFNEDFFAPRSDDFTIDIGAQYYAAVVYEYDEFGAFVRKSTKAYANISETNSMGLPIYPISEYFDDYPFTTGHKYRFDLRNLSTTTQIFVAEGDDALKVYWGSGELFNSNKWQNKKWVLFGDSITAQTFRADENYWGYIADETGINIENYAISGSGYKQGSTELPSVNVKSQVVNNLTAGADVITIAAGINDVAWLQYPIPAEVGDITDTEIDNTICGYINAAIDAIESVYDSYAPLIIISPLPACIQPGIFASPYQNRDQYPSAQPTCLMEVLVGKMKELCAFRGYPFIDLFHESGIQPQNAACRTDYFKDSYGDPADGLHPNADGHKLFYKKILKEIEKVIL